jgi:hypothetical protein
LAYEVMAESDLYEEPASINEELPEVWSIYCRLEIWISYKNHKFNAP